MQENPDLKVQKRYNTFLLLYGQPGLTGSAICFPFKSLHDIITAPESVLKFIPAILRHPLEHSKENLHAL